MSIITDNHLKDQDGQIFLTISTINSSSVSRFVLFKREVTSWCISMKHIQLGSGEPETNHCICVNYTLTKGQSVMTLIWFHDVSTQNMLHFEIIITKSNDNFQLRKSDSLCWLSLKDSSYWFKAVSPFTAVFKKNFIPSNDLLLKFHKDSKLKRKRMGSLCALKHWWFQHSQNKHPAQCQNKSSTHRPNTNGTQMQNQA